MKLNSICNWCVPNAPCDRRDHAEAPVAPSTLDGETPAVSPSTHQPETNISLENPQTYRGCSRPPLNTSASFSSSSRSPSPTHGRVAAETRSIDWTEAQRGDRGGCELSFHPSEVWASREDGAEDIYTLIMKNNTGEDTTLHLSRLQSRCLPASENIGSGFQLQIWSASLVVTITCRQKS